MIGATARAEVPEVTSGADVMTKRVSGALGAADRVGATDAGAGCTCSVVPGVIEVLPPPPPPPPPPQAVKPAAMAKVVMTNN